MRVIAGKARSLTLKTVVGMETRPTTDRIKETLFNILQPYLADCRFLDLFAGSGGIGIEALSRGAEFAYFVEKAPKAAACIKDNLTTTKLASQAKLLQMDVSQALAVLQSEPVLDIIFMDPPYNQEWEKKVLEILSASPLVDEYTLIVVEASLETKFDYLDIMGFEIERKKDYKTNSHIFIRKKVR